MLSIGHEGIVCRHADTDLTGRQLLSNANAALNPRQLRHDQPPMRDLLGAIAAIATLVVPQIRHSVMAVTNLAEAWSY